MIPSPVNGKKYRDEEAIKHSVIWDVEIGMSNSSHQEDQGGDDVSDGLDREDLCNQDLWNNWMMKQFTKEGPRYYSNVGTVQSTCIRCVCRMLRQGCVVCWEVGGRSGDSYYQVLMTSSAQCPTGYYCLFCFLLLSAHVASILCWCSTHCIELYCDLSTSRSCMLYCQHLRYFRSKRFCSLSIDWVQ